MSKNEPMRERLDKAMVARGLVPSRSRAQDLIGRGLVMVDGAVQQSASHLVGPGTLVVVTHAGSDHVSRGAEKLEAALTAFGFDASGRIGLDVGASTGGFTQVLLRSGACRVYAVDVGHGQMHPALRSNPRVVVHEGLDARHLDAQVVPEPVGAIVADVSFISLTKVLPNALALAAPGAWLVVLVKPQFEVGRAHVGKGGIVRDDVARQAAVEHVRGFIAATGCWRIVGVMPSPITGGSGNLEFLIGASLP